MIRFCFVFCLIHLFIFLIKINISSAQINSIELERYLELITDDEDQTELLEQLEDWLETPLDLNKATKMEMLMIPGFPPKSVNQILGKRKKQPFSSLGQVKNLLRMEEDIWNWVSQFLTVKAIQPRILKGDMRIRLSRPLEESKGFLEDRFSGGPVKSYQRYRLRYNEIQIGGVLEKDSGESSLVDHKVIGLEKTWGKSGRLVLGNYTLNIGSGLAIWSPFSIRKGSAPFYTTRRSNRTIRLHYSAFEADYFQGIAIKKSFGGLQAAGWMSDIKVDAGLTDSGELSGFVQTGLHRTETEKGKLNNARIRMLGGLLGYRWSDGFQIQLVAFKTDFDPEIAKDSNEPKEFNLAGKNLTVMGINLRGDFENGAYFAEVAWNENRDGAIILGGMKELSNLKILGLYRNYSPRYDNPYAHGFGERDGTNNETGWYIAMKYRPIKTATFTIWFDQFKTPWKTFNTRLPQVGSDSYFEWHQKINPLFRFYLRYTHETKTSDESIPAESPLFGKALLPFAKKRLRLHLQYKIQKDLEMATRIEAVRYSLSSSIHNLIKSKIDEGWIIYWEMRKSAPKSFLTGGTRFTFFNTQSFDARLYQFEQSVPGVLANKLLFGRGVRWYVFTKLRLSKNFIFSAKYASTRYEDRQTIGSGLDTIFSPVRHDISLQLDVKF